MGGRFIFLEKRLDRKFPEIGQRIPKRLVVLVPPRQAHQALGDIFRKASPDRTRRIAADNVVGGNVPGNDRSGRNYRAGADAATGQDNCAMPDPDVMADVDVAGFAPFEEFSLVALAREIFRWSGR